MRLYVKSLYPGWEQGSKGSLAGGADSKINHKTRQHNILGVNPGSPHHQNSKYVTSISFSVFISQYIRILLSLIKKNNFQKKGTQS